MRAARKQHRAVGYDEPVRARIDRQLHLALRVGVVDVPELAVRILRQHLVVGQRGIPALLTTVIVTGCVMVTVVAVQPGTVQFGPWNKKPWPEPGTANLYVPASTETGAWPFASV